MRHFLYILLLSGIISCTTENANITPNTTQTSKIKSTPMGIDEGANPANPYDNSGQSFLLLYDAYDALAIKPTEERDVFDSLERIATDLHLLSNEYDPYEFLNFSIDRELAFNEPIAYINSLNLQEQSKDFIKEAINRLNRLKAIDASYNTVYAELLDLESTVLNSSIIESDKKTLLVTLSIERYVIYNKRRRKRKDRDWELSVGNFLIMASSTNSSNAILNGVAGEFID